MGSCCVSLEVIEVVVARPTIKSGDVSLVVQSSVDDTCEEPLHPRSRIRENCASHGCPQESDLDFLFPLAMKELRRQMLPVSTGGEVCRVLKRSSDGWMRPPFSDFISVMRQFTIECRCATSARAAASLEEAKHTSRVALRPETAAVVRISAGLDCEAVSPLGSVVIPGSANFMPQTTA